MKQEELFQYADLCQLFSQLHHSWSALKWTAETCYCPEHVQPRLEQVIDSLEGTRRLVQQAMGQFVATHIPGPEPADRPQKRVD